MFGGDDGESLLWGFMAEVGHPSVFVGAFQAAVDDQTGGLDELMPMPHPQGGERGAGVVGPLGFPRSHPHDRRPDTADTATAGHLVAVGEQMVGAVDGDQAVGVLSHLEGEPLVGAEVAFDHLGEKPVEVGSGPQFGSRFPAHAPVVAHHRCDMDFPKLVGEHGECRAQLLRPMEQGAEHRVFVRLGEFLVDVAGEDVASQHDDHPVVGDASEIVAGDLDRVLRPCL